MINLNRLTFDLYIRHMVVHVCQIHRLKSQVKVHSHGLEKSQGKHFVTLIDHKFSSFLVIFKI